MQNRLGKLIECKRKERGLTVLDVATAVGVSERVVYEWQFGRKLPSLMNYLLLCDVLWLDMNEVGNELLSEYRQADWRESDTIGLWE